MPHKRTLELKIDKVERKGWDYLLHPQNAKQTPVLVDARYAKSLAMLAIEASPVALWLARL